MLVPCRCGPSSALQVFHRNKWLWTRINRVGRDQCFAVQWLNLLWWSPKSWYLGLWLALQWWNTANGRPSEVRSWYLPTICLFWQFHDSSTREIVARPHEGNRSDDSTKATAWSWCTPLSVFTHNAFQERPSTQCTNWGRFKCCTVASQPTLRTTVSTWPCSTGPSCVSQWQCTGVDVVLGFPGL